jgi:hypothetical protein
MLIHFHISTNDNTTTVAYNAKNLSTFQTKETFFQHGCSFEKTLVGYYAQALIQFVY